MVHMSFSLNMMKIFLVIIWTRQKRLKLKVVTALLTAHLITYYLEAGHTQREREAGEITCWLHRLRENEQ